MVFSVLEVALLLFVEEIVSVLCRIDHEWGILHVARQFQGLLLMIKEFQPWFLHFAFTSHSFTFTFTWPEATKIPHLYGP